MPEDTHTQTLADEINDNDPDLSGEPSSPAELSPPKAAPQRPAKAPEAKPEKQPEQTSAPEPDEKSTPPAKDDDSAKLPAAENASVVDDKLVARARALGIPEETIGRLSKHDGALDDFVASTFQYHQRVGAETRQRAPQGQPAPRQPNGQFAPHAPEQPAQRAAPPAQTPNEERMAAIERQFADWQQQQREMANAQIVRATDDALNAAPDIVREFIGTGDTMSMLTDPSKAAFYAQRMEVLQMADDLANGMRFAGRTPPPIPVLIESVLSMKYAKHLQGAQVKQVAEKLNQRTAQMTLPPTTRREEGHMPSTDQQLAAKANAFFQDRGFNIPNAVPDELADGI